LGKSTTSSRSGEMDDTINASIAASDLALNPLWNLSRTDPNCINASCLAYIYGWLQDQDRYNNNEFTLYAEWAVYFYCATIFVFALLYCFRRLGDGRGGTRLREKALACWRSFIYRRISGPLGESVDISFGQLTLLIISTIFIAILPFFQGYYFRALFRYGSPPLSVRCAFLISALLPILIALAGKVNLVSLLTGISYAKLNIWHRYVAFVIFGLATIHLVRGTRPESQMTSRRS
jgi:Ferric reductase like transmembrane component